MIVIMFAIMLKLYHIFILFHILSRSYPTHQIDHLLLIDYIIIL
jgi:hypothetical protein